MIGIVLIWLALIGAFVATLLFARPKGARLDPSCGKCGYLVRGLSTFICPECGSDLREVGIVSAPSAGRGPLRSNLPAKLLLAIVIYAPIGFTMGMVLLAYGPSLPLSDVVNDGLLAAMPPILGLIGVIVWILRRHKPDDATTEIASQPPAAGARRTRNLSIIFVDMHEYTTRVSRESRDGVIELVRRSRDLIQPIVHRRGGKIVKTIGDAFLITFDSPTDAVLTAREIQSGAHRTRRRKIPHRHQHRRSGAGSE
jgi:hypothetical protein